MESFKINPELYMQTVNRLKKICHINQEKCWYFFNMIMPDPTIVLLCGNTEYQTWSLFYTLPTAKIWHSLTSGLQLSSNISKELISHVMKQCHLLQENGFKNSLKNSKVTGSKNLFSAGSIVSNKGETVWKIEVYLWKQSTHHELYLCFVSLWCLDWEYGYKHKGTRWFKYDRDWFVCKQAALRSSCATLREWSHNLHPPSCSG